MVLEKLGYDSGGDLAADMFLGASDWDRAREGVDEGDWGKLLSGAALGTLAVGSLVPTGLMTKAGRSALQAKMAPRMGDEFVDGALGANLGGGGGAPPARMQDPMAGSRAGAPAWLDDPAYSSPAEGGIDRVMQNWADAPPAMPGGEAMPPAVPGIRDATTAEQIPEMRRMLDERARQFQESSFLANPANREDLARGLASMDGIDDAIEDTYRLTAGLTLPNRLPDEAFDAAGTQVVRGGRTTGPLSDYGTVASEFDRAQLGQAYWARRHHDATTDAARQEARLGYAREQMRQTQNLWLESDPTARGGTPFYMERAANIDRGRANVRAFSEDGEDLGPAFSRNVVAAMTAASSASAAPILEPVRMVTTMRYMRAMDDGTVRFMIDDWARDYPSLAGEKVTLKNGKTSYKGGMNYWGAQTAEAAINNPNVLDTFLPGIATKTGPYMVLGIDPANPWATVIDRNAIYLLAGHRRGKVPLLGRDGSSVGTLQDPFESQLAHQANHASNMRVLGGAMDRTGAGVQENTWFGPRLKQQPAIEDSFVMRAQPGVEPEKAAGSRSQFYKDLPEAYKEFPVDQDATWDQLVEYALDGAGSAYDPENAAAVKRIANRNYRDFSRRVEAGEVEGWQMLDGMAIPDRSSMEYAMPARDRFVKGAEDAAKRLEVVSVEELVAQGVDPKRNPKVRQAIAVLKSSDDSLGKLLRNMDEFKAHAFVAALLVGGGTLTATELMGSSGVRGEVTDADVQELLDGMDDFETGWV